MKKGASSCGLSMNARDPNHGFSPDVLAALDASAEDVREGRTVPFKTVMSELDASIARTRARLDAAGRAYLPDTSR